MTNHRRKGLVSITETFKYKIALGKLGELKEVKRRLKYGKSNC